MYKDCFNTRTNICTMALIGAINVFCSDVYDEPLIKNYEQIYEQ